jgi:hypothetical protein
MFPLQGDPVLEAEKPMERVQTPNHLARCPHGPHSASKTICKLKFETPNGQRLEKWYLHMYSAWYKRQDPLAGRYLQVLP